MKNLAVILLILCSCTQTISLRSPSNSEVHDSYIKDLKQLHKFALQDNSEEFCSQEMLSNAYDKMYGLTQDDVQLDTIGLEEKSKAIDLSFQIRVDSRKHLKFINDNPNLNNCFENYRNLTRALRYLEDFLIENIELAKKDSHKYKTLTGFGTYFLVHPDYKNSFTHYNDLKSGDVVLSRGKAYTSAAISRIASVDSQFSHMSFVYKDKIGRLYTTESHIEVGNVTADIKVHIDQENARTVVFRYNDKKEAHLASKCMFERVKLRQEKGNIIEYDFGMEHDKTDRLFCSEVAHAGFQCLEEKTDIPYTKSRFSLSLLPFLQSIGVQVTEKNIQNFKVLSPGDYEFDHRFELVAEWRNPKELRKIRMKDAILTKMFEWMENDNFTLRAKLKSKVKALTGWTLRRNKIPIKFLQDSKEKLKKKMPLNMSITQIRTFMTIEDVGAIMFEYLDKISKKENRLLSYAESMELLDESRKIEESKIIVGRTWYKYFRP